MSVTAQGGKVDRPIVAGRDQTFEYHSHNYSTPPTPESSPRVEPPPNLFYEGPQSKFVFISPFPRIGVHEPRNSGEQAEAAYALILKFTNKTIPGQRVGQASDVIATIKFKSDLTA